MLVFLTLYIEFFRTGLFALGGGLATIPFLQELIQKYGWITDAQLLDIIAIAESTPGAIGINAANYMGYHAGGFWGGVAAVLGLVSPSIVIIVIIAHYFQRFKSSQLVASAFYGIRPVVAGLIGAAGFEVAKLALFKSTQIAEAGGILDIINMKAMSVLIVGIILIRTWKKHPIVYIVCGAIVGVVLGL